MQLDVLSLASSLLLYQPSIVFDTIPSFISSEIAQASNIKNRTNRQSVERALRMFNSNLKTIKSIPDNGIIYCFGIDEYNNEIFEGIIPPNPVDRFYYKCDRRFHLDQFDEMFKKKSIGHVMFIDGTSCMIYQFNGIWTRLKNFDALLIKRQSKGGQSAIRFARLAEESRGHYITHVVDIVNELITDPKSTNYVFGGEELKNMFLTNSNLKPKFKTESVYHTFNRDTIREPYFVALMNKVSHDDVNKITDQIITYLDTDPDYLLFSIDEIKKQIKDVEYVLLVDNKLKEMEHVYPEVKFYMLNIDNKYYGRFKGFQIVAKLYYKQDEYVEHVEETHAILTDFEQLV